MSCLKIAIGRHKECSQYADKGYNDAKKEYGRRRDGCAESSSLSDLTPRLCLC